MATGNRSRPLRVDSGVDPLRSPESDRADRRTLGCVVALGAVVSAAVVGHNPLNTAATLLTTDVDEETVLATQGDVRLVQVDGYAIIDPVQRIELQRTFGPVSQATVVWQGRPEGDTADAASFSGQREATVTVSRWDGRVCTYRTGFDALTLAPDQPYDDWESTGSGC
jgi:hypothetical protein